MRFELESNVLLGVRLDELDKMPEARHTDAVDARDQLIANVLIAYEGGVGEDLGDDDNL
jgi:hypothetical protein